MCFFLKKPNKPKLTEEVKPKEIINIIKKPIMNKFLWILDAGHGGMVNGQYTTAPKKMYDFKDGLIIYEGVVNRGIRKFLSEMMDEACFNYDYANKGNADISLGKRVNYANNLGKSQDTIYVSIHCNAGKGTGYEVYTSPGLTKSDPIATIFAKEFVKVFPNKVLREDASDGDPDKEARFYVLKNTSMPAILTENLFMDRREDAEILATEDGQRKIALAHFNAIKLVEDNWDKENWKLND